ncbi:lysozyme family protein [Pseudonocardia sp. DLS-67]
MVAPILVVGLLIGGVADGQADGATIDTSRLSPDAARLLPALEGILASECPELPLPFAAAHIQVESSWKPHAFNPDGRAAGLYQFREATWISAGGKPWSADPPPADADVFDAVRHLEVALPWLCTNLRRIRAHLADTGKPTDPLDALLVCHIAGCTRVTGSATGMPSTGEADCDSACADTITRYVTTVRTQAQRLTAEPVPASLEGLPTPTAFSGNSAGCTEPDPSSSGCLTPAAEHALDEILRAFGTPGPDAPIRSFTCWDEHAWNPSSDHGHGRACDFFPAQPGAFPAESDVTDGWRLANWLRAHADPLRVRYIIWQGRIWSPTTPDNDGWGRRYSGGGIYDVHDATGGHYDHIHFSVTS